MKGISVVQGWVTELPMMQQTVLFTAIRGPDGLPKYGCVKMLLRWYRRCILLAAMEGRTLTTPYEDDGGSFTGPSIQVPEDGRWDMPMHLIVDDYLRSLDAVPHHFQLHLMHGVEILGYKHPDEGIRTWWNQVYLRLVKDMHLNPESEGELDMRLGDDHGNWLASADPATVQ